MKGSGTESLRSPLEPRENAITWAGGKEFGGTRGIAVSTSIDRMLMQAAAAAAPSGAPYSPERQEIVYVESSPSVSGPPPPLPPPPPPQLSSTSFKPIKLDSKKGNNALDLASGINSELQGIYTHGASLSRNHLYDLCRTQARRSSPTASAAPLSFSHPLPFAVAATTTTSNNSTICRHNSPGGTPSRDFQGVAAGEVKKAEWPPPFFSASSSTMGPPPETEKFSSRLQFSSYPHSNPLLTAPGSSSSPRQFKSAAAHRMYYTAEFDSPPPLRAKEFLTSTTAATTITTATTTNTSTTASSSSTTSSFAFVSPSCVAENGRKFSSFLSNERGAGGKIGTLSPSPPPSQTQKRGTKNVTEPVGAGLALERGEGRLPFALECVSGGLNDSCGHFANGISAKVHDTERRSGGVLCSPSNPPREFYAGNSKGRGTVAAGGGGGDDGGGAVSIPGSHQHHSKNNHNGGGVGVHGSLGSSRCSSSSRSSNSSSGDSEEEEELPKDASFWRNEVKWETNIRSFQGYPNQGENSVSFPGPHMAISTTPFTSVGIPVHRTNPTGNQSNSIAIPMVAPAGAVTTSSSNTTARDSVRRSTSGTGTGAGGDGGGGTAPTAAVLAGPSNFTKLPSASFSTPFPPHQHPCYPSVNKGSNEEGSNLVHESSDIPHYSSGTLQASSPQAKKIEGRRGFRRGRESGKCARDYDSEKPVMTETFGMLIRDVAFPSLQIPNSCSSCCNTHHNHGGGVVGVGGKETPSMACKYFSIPPQQGSVGMPPPLFPSAAAAPGPAPGQSFYPTYPNAPFFTPATFPNESSSHFVCRGYAQGSSTIQGRGKALAFLPNTGIYPHHYPHPYPHYPSHLHQDEDDSHGSTGIPTSHNRHHFHHHNGISGDGGTEIPVMNRHMPGQGNVGCASGEAAATAAAAEADDDRLFHPAVNHFSLLPHSSMLLASDGRARAGPPSPPPPGLAAAVPPATAAVPPPAEAPVSRPAPPLPSSYSPSPPLPKDFTPEQRLQAHNEARWSEPHLYYPRIILPEKQLNLGGTEELRRRLVQRWKQITYGKSSRGYFHYRLMVPRIGDREFHNPMHPVTPRPDYHCSKRAFDKVLNMWRRQLHKWDEWSMEQKEGKERENDEAEGEEGEEEELLKRWRRKGWEKEREEEAGGEGMTRKTRAKKRRRKRKEKKKKEEKGKEEVPVEEEHRVLRDSPPPPPHGENNHDGKDKDVNRAPGLLRADKSGDMYSTKKKVEFKNEEMKGEEELVESVRRGESPTTSKKRPKASFNPIEKAASGVSLSRACSRSSYSFTSSASSSSLKSLSVPAPIHQGLFQFLHVATLRDLDLCNDEDEEKNAPPPLSFVPVHLPRASHTATIPPPSVVEGNSASFPSSSEHQEELPLGATSPPSAFLFHQCGAALQYGALPPHHHDPALPPGASCPSSISTPSQAQRSPGRCFAIPPEGPSTALPHPPPTGLLPDCIISIAQDAFSPASARGAGPSRPATVGEAEGEGSRLQTGRIREKSGREPGLNAPPPQVSQKGEETRDEEVAGPLVPPHLGSEEETEKSGRETGCHTPQSHEKERQGWYVGHSMSSSAQLGGRPTSTSTLFFQPNWSSTTTMTTNMHEPLVYSALDWSSNTSSPAIPYVQLDEGFYEDWNDTTVSPTFNGSTKGGGGASHRRCSRSMTTPVGSGHSLGHPHYNGYTSTTSTILHGSSSRSPTLRGLLSPSLLSSSQTAVGGGGGGGGRGRRSALS